MEGQQPRALKLLTRWLPLRTISRSPMMLLRRNVGSPPFSTDSIFSCAPANADRILIWCGDREGRELG